VAGVALGVVTGLEPWKSPPPPPGLMSATRADQLKELERLRIYGIKLATEKKYTEAVSIFLRLNYVNEHDPFAYQQLASLISGAGAVVVEKLVADGMASRPNAADADKIMGGVYYYAGKSDEAMVKVERYLAANPGDLNATFFKGAVVRKRGDNTGAIELLKKVVEKEPTHYYAYIELQQAYETMGDKNMATRMLGLALKNSPASKEGVCCGLPPDKKAAEKGKRKS